MGAILKAFKVLSSAAAKKAGVWEEIIDELTECQTIEDIASFKDWVARTHWNLPYPFREPLSDEIEARVQAILVDEEVLRTWPGSSFGQETR